VGQVGAMAGLVKLIYDPLVQISIQGLSLSGGIIELEKIFAVLDLPVHQPPGQQKLDTSARRLTFQHVWFRHPAPGTATLPDLAAETATIGEHDRTVTDLTFSLIPGGTTALVGPSGAGKTTTALLAVGVHRPTRGRCPWCTGKAKGCRDRRERPRRPDRGRRSSPSDHALRR
jgi:ATP-binding cassette, subfamily B, bacterial